MNLISQAQTGVSDQMRLALRIPTREVYLAIKPYQDGRKASIPFVFYGRIETMEELILAGAVSGQNPAELGVLIGCDTESINSVRNSLNRYTASGIKYLMQDCELGTDKLWSQPDVPALVGDLAPLINGNSDFSWQVAMQFGYLENTYGGGGGDLSVCSGRDLSTCDIGRSYAGNVWQNYNSNDIFTVFGQSASQQTPDEFELVNSPWLNYMKVNHPQNNWWGVSGLTDKNGDGTVDILPQTVYEIAKKAQNMGAAAFGVIWLGREPQALFGPTTRMDELLDLWVNGFPTPSPVPTVFPIPTSSSGILGDLNNDGIVNIQDFVILSNIFGTNDSRGDFNNDGVVNIQDFVILSNNFGQT